MKTTTNYGAPRPLNWRDPLYLEQKINKSEEHARAIAIAQRAGTPPTRMGMFNGAMPATTPAIPAELNPALFLKAVVDPAMAGSGRGDSKATARRRDSTGKFAPTSSQGDASTAEEDAAAAARVSRQAAARYEKALGVPDVPLRPQQPAQNPQLSRPKPPMNPMDGAGIPGSPPGMSPTAQNMQGQGGPPSPGGPPPGGQMGQGGGTPGAMDQPLGQTPDGMPIYDDPHHPNHSNFSPEHHQAASDLHGQMAQQALMQGKTPTALDHQLKQKIHGDMANDAQTPSARAAQKFGQAPMQGGAPGMPGQPPMGNQPGQDPMGDFMNLMGNKQPGNQNSFPDQNKPTMGQPQGGPKPGLLNTQTGGPMGPQTNAQGMGGAVQQPQGMPATPQGGSMPEPGNGLPPMPGEMPTDPFDWSPDDFGSDGEQSGEGGNPDQGGQPPDSNAGAPSDVGGNERKPEPSGNGSESSPGDDAGPSTEDKPEEGDAGPPFGGNPTEDKAKQTFKSWFMSI